MIKIVTDSTCDLSQSEVEQLNIHVVPLSISIDGETYVDDGIDITPHSFIEKMKRSKELPKSSQPPVGKFVDLYDQLGSDGSEVLSIHMSGKMSGTVDAARTAAKMTNTKVTVIDSLHISKGLAFQVREAAKKASKGCGLKEIIERVQAVKNETKLFVVVDTLENLVKGGRIGKGKALIGSLLKIKPIAFLEEGEYSPVAKVRSHSQAVKYLVKQFVKDMKGKTIKGVGIAHADGLDFAIKLKTQIETVTGYQAVEISPTTPIVSTHTGRGAIGFVYYGE